MSETTTEETAPTTEEWKPPESQADLDRIINERLARQKAQFKDYDDLKSKAAEFDKQQEAQKSELEKTQSDLTRWQTEAETWRSAAVSNTVKALAAADFADPDDAVRNLDVSKYLDAGGDIDEKTIQADLAALLEAKPHYRRAEEQQSPRAPRPNQAQGSGGQPVTDPAQELAAIVRGQLGT